MDINVSFDGTGHLTDVESQVYQLVNKIAKHSPIIQDCNVIVSKPHKHQKSHNQYKATVRVHPPKMEPLVVHTKHEHAHEAVAKAFKIMDRKLRRTKEKRYEEKRKKDVHH